MAEKLLDLPEEGLPHGAVGAIGDGRELAWLPECVIGRWEAERGGPFGVGDGLVTTESPSNTKALGLHELKGGGSCGLGGGSDQGASGTEAGTRDSEQQLPGSVGPSGEGGLKWLATHGHWNPPGG